MTSINHTLITLIRIPFAFCLLIFMTWNTPLYWQMIGLIDELKTRLWG